MKEKTRRMRDEARRDISAIYGRRSKTQQGREDRARAFSEKWTALKAEAETEAQRAYCDDVISRCKYTR